MSGRHLDHQFDAELEDITRRVLSMGGLVENQVSQALYCVACPTPEVVQRVLQRERDVNAMELEIDREVCSIITRRQPAAMDLRLLMALSKTTANLERAGDEAVKVARMGKAMHEHSRTRDFPTSGLRIAGDLASEQLSKSLDALARMDAPSALSLLEDDLAIKAALEGFVRSMITHMANDTRSVRAGLDLLFAAKAIERIGAHAKNLAEFTIYATNGLDVRHSSSAGRLQPAAPSA
ncbi:phosphate signaling complex protein PhoU [Acidovorax sp.]|uniref:phosphate signaling complex protein PhoU n=1 Tax=Acidovorax sp. TaxID=1872122 RepID=UPI002ACE889F|nr:phosphate signaling complex protein PhoU [Acidovorax sp.]MDZ7865975.1 phosphate signaling complex protein PhoU [Acidovorax sp.]